MRPVGLVCMLCNVGRVEGEMVRCALFRGLAASCGEEKVSRGGGTAPVLVSIVPVLVRSGGVIG